MIDIIYFASIREQLGLADESIDIPQGVESVADLSSWLQAQRGEKWITALGNISTLIAVNQEMVGLEHVIQSGDEIAFFPPVTGG
ncbi:MAG: molybdopterin converting factor, subunit 1 [Osedax symbiont Rs1]|nr:MAG: molybdopterin converting factor, subunit 1 [Osedax symbiont Rs1]